MSDILEEYKDIPDSIEDEGLLSELKQLCGLLGHEAMLGEYGRVGNVVHGADHLDLVEELHLVLFDFEILGAELLHTGNDFEQFLLDREAFGDAGFVVEYEFVQVFVDPVFFFVAVVTHQIPAVTQSTLEAAEGVVQFSLLVVLLLAVLHLQQLLQSTLGLFLIEHLHQSKVHEVD